MTSRSPSSPRPPGRLLAATQATWPLVAGAVTAVGLIGSVQIYGLLGVALIFAGSTVFAIIMVYATFAEGGVRDVPLVRSGLAAALALLVLLGIVNLFPIAGWAVVLVVGVTCPLVTNRLAKRTPREQPAPTGSPEDGASTAYQRMVDRTFTQIVAGLEKDGSWGQDA